MRSRQNRLGFTLVELLVVIAIIGILVTLLLPAVQSAREAARRINCVNNIRNLALAAINHHDQQGHFPVDEDYYKYGSVVADVNVRERTRKWVPRSSFDLPPEGPDGGGWIVRILPNLEEQALYDRFNVPGHGINGSWITGQTGMNWNDPAFRAALAVQPPILVCPSDEIRGPSEVQYPYSSAAEVPGGPVLVATTSYKGNAGDGHFEFTTIPQPTGYWTYNPMFQCYDGDDCVGMFWRASYLKGGVRIRKITDGTSKTYLVGEASPVDNNSAAWSSDGDWAHTAIELNWDFENSGFCSSMGNRNCWPRIRGFRSNHPGGANFAMVDGSVSFETENVDHLIYRAKSTRQGNEVIGGSP